MPSGKSVYRKIRSRVDAARAELARVAGELDSLRGQSEQARAEEARALARLARVRLDELEGDRVAGRLDAADREALALLADRDRERERIQQAVDEGAAQLATMVAERGERLEARDAAAKAFHEQVEATRQRLDGVDSYRSQRSHTEFAAGQAGNSGIKAQQAEGDRDTKRQPYERDKLFSYLWRRRYRFPEYRAWPLFATLDGWVARLCDYDRSHRDYTMLLEIPVRLRAHADALAASAQEQAELLADMESRALAEDGGVELRATWDQAQADLDDAEARLAAAEAEQDRRCLEQASLHAGNDPYSSRAAAALEAQLAAEDVMTLRRDAAATPTAADDELVALIASLRDRFDGLQPRLAELEGEHQSAQRTFDDLEDIARKFRSRDFEADNSEFSGGFDIGTLLGGLLQGGRRSDIWSTLRRHQSWRSSGSLFGGLGSSGGSSSSGGFGGFGGFGGGGGFSSGGGFGGGGGGGGGFSTGGGF